VFVLDTFEIHDDEINVEEIMQKIRDNIKRRNECDEFHDEDQKLRYEQAENYEYLSGWHDIEDLNGTPTRWMGDDAILMINSDSTKNVELSFKATSYIRPRSLRISDGNHQEVSQIVPTTLTLIKVPISLKEGPNIIRFKVPEGGDLPDDTSEKDSEDSKCKSIAVQGITITVQNGLEEAKRSSAPGPIINSMAFTPEVIDVGSMKKHLHEINSMWDIENNSYNISSHRLVTGKFLVKGRELVHGEVRRYVDPMIRKQKEFNHGVVNSLNDIVQKIDMLIEMGEVHRQAKIDIETIDVENRMAQAKAEIGKDIAGNIETLRSEIDRRIDGRIMDAVASLNDDLDKKAWLARVLERRLEKVKDQSVSSESNDLGINYFVFEEKFRGPRKEIKKRQSAFLEYFKGCKKVLDIGCGRGEFLELLQENGIEAQGVDMDEDMVGYCRSKGLKVMRTDAVSFLEVQEDKSLDGIFLDQVVEHLEPAYLVKMLELCYKKLNYGYHIVVETVNPLSLTSFANFYIDMTHKRPMHPETLKYLLTSMNFRDTDIKFFAPIPDDQKLKRLCMGNGSNIEKEIVDAHNYNVDLLNNILYGSQDYMVFAKK
jgi:2-polyprenyl-3-methyl-5-hydroxy-6-metoxy-1,4-benzoquinol methylase